MSRAKHIQITLSEQLLKQIDSAAYEEYATRSEFIRRALTMYLAPIAERRARLKAVVDSGDMPSEADLLQMLKLKHAQIEAHKMLKRARLI